MCRFQWIIFMMATASGHSITEVPQLHNVQEQSSAETCKQAPGAALLQHGALVSGSRRGEFRGTLLSAPASSDDHVIDNLLEAINASSTRMPNFNITSSASSSGNSSATTSNASVTTISSKDSGEVVLGPMVSGPMAAARPRIVSNSSNDTSAIAGMSSITPSPVSTTSPVIARDNASATVINDSFSQPSGLTSNDTGLGEDIGVDAKDLPLLGSPADQRPSSVMNGRNATTPISGDNDPILNQSTKNSGSSSIARSNTSVSASNLSSSDPLTPTESGPSLGKDSGVHAKDLPMLKPPADEGLNSVIKASNDTNSSSNIINGLNSTSPVPSANDSSMNSSTTSMRPSTIGGTNESTSKTNSSSTNSSMTVNITVSKKGHAETRVKRCKNGMCKVHNRTWHTSDPDEEAGVNPANWTENVSNISDILKWLDDAFKAPTVWNEGILDGPQPFSEGAEWHGWDDVEPGNYLPVPLNALAASLSEGFLRPWLKGREVGLSGHLPWGLRSHDLIVDQRGRDVIVAYHLGSPEKLEIRQVVALTQVPRGEPLQIYDDASGSFELRWPCGYED